MLYRAKRTSEYIAISLFAGVLLLFIQLRAVTEKTVPDIYLRGILTAIFSALRLAVPALIFVYMQKLSGDAPVKIEKAPECPEKCNITLAFVGFAFIFCFGMLYSAAFPSAANSFDDSNIFSAFITVLGYAIVPAVFEEILYRKIFCAELTVHGGVFAAIISALLFGLGHFSFYAFPYAFICGLVLAFVYLKTGSVKYTVAIHFANNLLGYVCAFISTKLDKLDYTNVMLVLFIAIGVSALGACHYLMANMKKFALCENGGAPSSVFLTFPMVVYIFCAVLINFI